MSIGTTEAGGELCRSVSDMATQMHGMPTAVAEDAR